MQTQDQAYCHRCGTMRLHTRVTRDVPHILHLLLTIFLCGFWFPIWILDIITNSFEQSSEPYRCTNCGRAENEPTQAQKVKIAHDAERASAERAERIGKVAHGMGAMVGSSARGTAWLSSVTAKELIALPRRIDSALRKIAGEGNVIVYRFLQILSVLFYAGIVSLAGWVIIARVRGWT